jgi:hypothetical protein
MNNWFGVLNPLSKMMIVAVLIFFRCSSTSQLTWWSLPPRLMRSYAASESSASPPRQDPERLAILLHGPQGRDHPESDRRDGEYFGGTSSVLGQVIVAARVRCASTSPRSFWRR